jgi:uncharacterized membrane protein
MRWLIVVTEQTMVVIDAFALIAVIIGTVEAFVAVIRTLLRPLPREARWRVLSNYGRWLVAGLTFQLAADILETSITTTWQAVARLGAVAVIRTFLNYFLEHDLDAALSRRAGAARSSAPPGA